MDFSRGGKLTKYVEAGTPEAERFGFTSDLWRGYLAIRGCICYVCQIRSLSPREGNLNRLFDAIRHERYELRIVNPSKTMETILIHKGGFTPTVEQLNGNDEIVWREARW